MRLHPFKSWYAPVLAALLILPVCAQTEAGEDIKVGGTKAWLEKPDNPVAGLVIVPGGGGLSKNDPLQRLRKDIANQGVAVLSVDSKTKLRAATKLMSQIAKPVNVAAVSRGMMGVTKTLSKQSLKLKGLVLVAGDLNFMRQKLKDPGKLPRTLVIHHRQDGCQKTPPSAVEGFKKWAGAKVKVVWMDGGQNRGNPCGPDAYHGLAGLEDKTVRAIAEFLKP
ncbi:hypothetical protein V5T82_09430 [Magnetovibrio sp. PR-2]|uniref:hypothetical protein n=1 Tax=Magnetovibrio sp. PR-2 TaxID=3120356 RepID=UPI002FCE4FD8